MIRYRMYTARLSYLPNIYVLGEEGVQKFCEVYITVAQ